LQACAANSETRAEIIGPVWVAETITGMPVIAGSQVTLKFDADGKAGGNAGCNTYGSGYQRDGTKIEFEQPFSTKMFCSPDAVMTQEQAYFDMLNRTTTYETPTDKLILQAPNGQTVVFHRQQ
jgi:heat shock protein HslJ